MPASGVFVLCPDYPAPSGGIRKLYTHVDVLSRNGIPAAILHQQDGFRLKWFEHATPVVYAKSTRLSADDYLVVPEVLGPDIASIAPGIRKVIFNQNSYLTFRGYSLDGQDVRTPYTHPDILATLTVSEDNFQYLRHAFPALRLVRLHYGIDTRLFSARLKKNRIALMPRKNAEEVVQVINILKHRGVLRGYEIVLIDGRPEHEVAAILGKCRFFFSFGYPEGCPLPPLEAMSCGCVVVGYHGWGGREYLLPEFSCPVEVGDVVNFAKAAERVLCDAAADPARFEEMGRRAAAFVHERYSLEREERDILAFWKPTLGIQRTS
jgi:glycosyltransferase involved in cell wall biosynthesis